MPVQFSCPECQAVLRSSKPIAPGKMIRCPKCEVFFAPQLDELEPEGEEEEVRDARQADDYDADDDRDYDEEEERPRRKKRKFRSKKKASGSSALMLGIVGGSILFLLLAVGGVLGFMDIPGMAWTGFLKAHRNAGPANEDPLAYLPPESSMIMGADLAGLYDSGLGNGIRQAMTQSQGANDMFSDCPGNIGVTISDLYNHVFLATTMPLAGNNAMAGPNIQGNLMVVIKSRIPFDQRKIWRFCHRANNFETKWLNGKFYYVDTQHAEHANGWKFLYTPSDSVMVLANVPDNVMESVLKAEGTQVRLPEQAAGMIQKAQQGLAWVVYPIPETARAEMQRGMKQAAALPELQPLARVLKEVGAVGAWATIKGTKAHLHLGAQFHNARSAKVAADSLQKAYESQVQGFVNQAKIAVALALAPPSLRAIAKEAVASVRFSTHESLAEASTSVKVASLRTAFQELQMLQARGGMGFQPGGRPGFPRRGPGGPGAPGFPGGRPFRGGPGRPNMPPVPRG